MFARVGVSKASQSHNYLPMLIKLLILAISVSTCVAIANVIEDDYVDESIQRQQERPESFHFDNLERLRTKLKQGARYRSNNGNDYSSGSGNTNSLRKSFRSGSRTSSNSSRDQDRNSSSKRHNNDNQPNFNELEFYDELESGLPYGIQNVRRDLPNRSTRSQSHIHKPKTTFQSLCPSRRTIIPLETVSYEYRPDHYEEVTCFHSYAPSRDYMSETNKVCSEAGFTCIQLNRTVYLTRRAKGTDCWESETRIVPSGCECMWPKHTFGDIITYH